MEPPLRPLVMLVVFWDSCKNKYHVLASVTTVFVFFAKQIHETVVISTRHQIPIESLLRSFLTLLRRPSYDFTSFTHRHFSHIVTLSVRYHIHIFFTISMAPAETPKKGSPSKGTSAKKTPTKGTPKKMKARSKVTVADLSSKSTEAITFLWAALQHELGKTGSAVSSLHTYIFPFGSETLHELFDSLQLQVDYQAVGDVLGITKCAATFRYYRIRDAFANDAENANNPAQESPQDNHPKRSRAKAFKGKTKDDSDEDTEASAAKPEDIDHVIKKEEFDIKIETEEAMEEIMDKEIEPEADIRYVKMEEDVDFEA